MNCYKCGKEMRVVPEQVATDEKGLPVYHRIGYCDACMSKFDIDIVEKQNQKKKKQSTLSILSVVFTLIGLTIPVAIILAIIDIVKGDKNNKNHSGSWFSIIFSVIVIFVYFLGGQNEENQNVSNNVSIESVIETESQTIELPDESVENYLETILVLSKKLPVVRSVDISNELGYKKSSISVAMKNLRENNYITMSDAGFISLTDSGKEIAEMIYERHELLSAWLIQLGVDPDIASADACKIEHVISKESFKAIKDHVLSEANH